MICLRNLISLIFIVISFDTYQVPVKYDTHIMLQVVANYNSQDFVHSTSLFFIYHDIDGKYIFVQYWDGIESYCLLKINYNKHFKYHRLF